MLFVLLFLDDRREDIDTCGIKVDTQKCGPNNPLRTAHARLVQSDPTIHCSLPTASKHKELARQDGILSAGLASWRNMEFIVVNAKTMGTLGGWMTIAEASSRFIRTVFM